MKFWKYWGQLFLVYMIGLSDGLCHFGGHENISNWLRWIGPILLSFFAIYNSSKEQK